MTQTATAPKPRLTSLKEYTDSRGQTLTVDREKGVIRGVKILGLESANGRTYRTEAIRKAIGLYEGAKVNVNHPAGKATDPRDYRDRLGHFESVQQRSDGLYGDLHYNPKHSVAEQLAWDAEHAPNRLGMSHNVAAKTSRDRTSGKVVVEEIASVVSVDLVADPATTQGLFESEGYMDPAATPAESTASPEEAVSLAFKAAVNKVLDDTSLDLGGKMTKIKAILKSQESAMAALVGDSKSSESTGDDTPPATEGKQATPPAGDVAKLQEQVTKLTAELEARAALEAAGVTLSPVNFKAYSALTSDEDRKAFIAEHKGTPNSSGGKPKSTDQWGGTKGGEQVTEAKNGEEFAAQLRRASRPVFGRTA